MGFDKSESVVIDFSIQSNFPAPLADLNMFHVMGETGQEYRNYVLCYDKTLLYHPIRLTIFFCILQTINLLDEDDLEPWPMQPS